MSFYWQDAGEIDVIENYLKVRSGLSMGLFTAPTEISWDETKEYGDLTEVIVSGYTRQALDSGDWVRTGSIAEQPYKQFDFDSGVTILGYFIIDSTSGTGEVLAVEYFTSAKVMLAGEYLKVKPIIEVK